MEPTATASLDTLPTELLSQICKLLRHRKHGPNSKCGGHNEFHSLRRMCRALYDKTMYDFINRNTNRFAPARFNLTSQDIILLLHLSSIPEFRDRIEVVRLKRSKHAWDNRLRWTREYFPWGKFKVYAPKWESLNQWMREDPGFENSPELLWMLREAFNKLASAKMLRSVDIEFAFPIVLSALHQSSLGTRKGIAALRIRTGKIERYLRDVEGLALNPDHKNGLVRTLTLDSHDYRNHRASETAAMHSLFAALPYVSELRLGGCAPGTYKSKYAPPRQRDGSNWDTCPGCRFFVTTHLHAKVNPNITSLFLHSTAISGGVLRRYLRENRDIIRRFKAFDTSLSDGLWHPIFVNLKKCPSLEYVGFAAIHQHWTRGVFLHGNEDVRDKPPERRVQATGVENVQIWLESVILEFRVHQDWSRYKQVDLKVVEGCSEKIPIGEMHWRPKHL